jgi:hypothetical protein
MAMDGMGVSWTLGSSSSQLGGHLGGGGGGPVVFPRMIHQSTLYI